MKTRSGSLNKYLIWSVPLDLYGRSLIFYPLNLPSIMVASSKSFPLILSDLWHNTFKSLSRLIK